MTPGALVACHCPCECTRVRRRRVLLVIGLAPVPGGRNCRYCAHAESDSSVTHRKTDSTTERKQSDDSMTNKSRAHGTASTSLAAAGNGADGAGTELTAPRHSASPPALPPMTESTAAAPSTPPRPVCRFDLESPVVLHPIGTSLSSPRLAVESVMAHHFDMPVSESQLSSLVKRDFHHVWSTFTALHDSRRLLENWTVPRLEREWRRWLLRCVQEAEKKDEFNARLKQTKKVQIIHSGQHYRMVRRDRRRRGEKRICGVTCKGEVLFSVCAPAADHISRCLLTCTLSSCRLLS